jgi:hypothetical protein
MIRTAEVDDPYAMDVPGRLPPGGMRRGEEAEHQGNAKDEP